MTVSATATSPAGPDDVKLMTVDDMDPDLLTDRPHRAIALETT
ncbi:hypothetical protein ACFV0T_06705 [Streptomyces sp. NPDC059582]